MRIGRKSIVAISIVLVLIAAGGLAFERYWYYIPGIIANLKNPIEPNRPVAWEKGPEVASTPADRRPPNVIVILADDLGFNDITFNGGGVATGAVPTPNIDSIGHDGVSFTNGYAGNATCAPSRAAIMTGRYATRFGFEFTPAPVNFARLIARMSHGQHPTIYDADVENLVPPFQEMVVPPTEIMIGQIMKTRGYHTLFFGKWHLGETDVARPDRRGFDEALGFLSGASMYLPAGDPDAAESRQDFDPIDKFLWANLPYAVTFNGSHRFAPSKYMTDYLGDEAVEAIKANVNRPFFMYLAFNAPHTPLQATKEDYDALPQIADHRLRVYAAMIRALDRNVGKVLATLKENGLDKNTLVIFTSDNGGANYIGLPDINKPYRGWKATFFEGGIHVPYMMRWPAKIPAGTVYTEPAAHTDIFATAAHAAGAALPTDRLMDGVDLISFATGAAQGEPHKSLFWRSGAYKTLIEGGWKLQVSHIPDAKWLYDLKTDPTEKHDLSASDPAKLDEMLASLNRIDAVQHKPLWPSLLEGAIPIDHPLSYPESPTDAYVYWAN
ncbi:MAG: sulfatase-like hydrolase/transferase [Parvibaculum sp.]|uniref:sulfatase-like hydrolase/transferase n=1 Tax=Parvibaculum sp. TaxID=2024848 RepID=UPI0028479DF8|nr:sulfatase-like hydrolase/transferase [Parvibaculum sp.]MDR3499871.1 sulfatase-like hydrolase/transferase [Parvibaculum sp.]